jgi:hypothetical protein
MLLEVMFWAGDIGDHEEGGGACCVCFVLATLLHVDAWRGRDG